MRWSPVRLKILALLSSLATSLNLISEPGETALAAENGTDREFKMGRCLRLTDEQLKQFRTAADPDRAYFPVSDTVLSALGLAEERRGNAEFPPHVLGAVAFFQMYHAYHGSFSTSNPYMDFSYVPLIREFAAQIRADEISRLLQDVEKRIAKYGDGSFLRTINFITDYQGDARATVHQSLFPRRLRELILGDAGQGSPLLSKAVKFLREHAAIGCPE